MAAPVLNDRTAVAVLSAGRNHLDVNDAEAVPGAVETVMLALAEGWGLAAEQMPRATRLLRLILTALASANAKAPEGERRYGIADAVPFLNDAELRHRVVSAAGVAEVTALFGASGAWDSLFPSEQREQMAPLVLRLTQKQWRARRVCCELDRDAPVWVAVWAANGEPESRRARALEQAVEDHNRQAAPGQALTVREVRHHIAYHRPPQPTQSVQVKHLAQEVLATDGLSLRDRAVLELVGQLGVIGASAFAERFGCSEASARRTLKRLARRNYLHNAQASRRVGDTGSRSVYLLSPLGRALVERLHDGEPRVALRHIYTASQLGKPTLAHDLRANEVLARLARDAAERPLRQSKGESPRRLELFVPSENLLGPRSLSMGFDVPAYWEGGVRGGGVRENIHPDGFLTLGIREEGAFDVGLGLWLEFDSGANDAAGAVGREQLFSYVALAYAAPTPVKARFPEFDVAGYQVPALFVTQSDALRAQPEETRLTERSRRLARVRAFALMRAFFARIGKVRFENPDLAGSPLPPLYICGHAELRAYGLDVPVWCLHRAGGAGEPIADGLPFVPQKPLWLALLDDATAASELPRLNSQTPITINREGGRAFNVRKNAPLSANQRAQHEEEAHQLQAELETMAARQRAREEQRLAALGGVA